MFYLALSCLQGQDVISASKELLSLKGVDGLQLTSGNKFNKEINYYEWLKENKVKYRVHHNFSFTQSINHNLYCLFKEDDEYESGFEIHDVNSLHPPLYKRFSSYSKDYIDEAFFNFLNGFEGEPLCFEIMYDPKQYPLSNDEQINYYLDLDLPIAIDISHLKILEKQGHINQKTKSRLLNYNNIEEIHISDNNGDRDSHQFIKHNTYLLDWVEDRYRNDNDTPIVLECFMQRMSQEQRQYQVDILLDKIRG